MLTRYMRGHQIATEFRWHQNRNAGSVTSGNIGDFFVLSANIDRIEQSTLTCRLNCVGQQRLSRQLAQIFSWQPLAASPRRNRTKPTFTHAYLPMPMPPASAPPTETPRPEPSFHAPATQPVLDPLHRQYQCRGSHPSAPGEIGSHKRRLAPKSLSCAPTKSRPSDRKCAADPGFSPKSALRKATFLPPSHQKPAPNVDTHSGRAQQKSEKNAAPPEKYALAR